MPHRGARHLQHEIKVVAYEYRGGKLHELWSWNDRESGARYRGRARISSALLMWMAMAATR